MWATSMGIRVCQQKVETKMWGRAPSKHPSMLWDKNQLMGRVAGMECKLIKDIFQDLERDKA
jgi:hypothetical protein